LTGGLPGVVVFAGDFLAGAGAFWEVLGRDAGAGLAVFSGLEVFLTAFSTFLGVAGVLDLGEAFLAELLDEDMEMRR
jgi:hypothetical protein